MTFDTCEFRRHLKVCFDLVSGCRSGTFRVHSDLSKIQILLSYIFHTGTVNKINKKPTTEAELAEVEDLLDTLKIYDLKKLFVEFGG